MALNIKLNVFCMSHLNSSFVHICLLFLHKIKPSVVLDTIKNIFPVFSKSRVPTTHFNLQQSFIQEVSHRYHIDLLSALSSRLIQHRFLLPWTSTMTNNASYSGFLSLPLELRDEIYRHLLPDVDDICPVPRSRLQLYHIKYVPCLRTDDEQCHPEILAVNKQINAEASRVLYARTYTMKFFLNRVTFLGRE